MKTFILCGGMGSRLDNEGQIKPKPLVNIGNEPILIHIIKIYSEYNFNEFVLCLGYKGGMIKDFLITKYKKKIKKIFVKNQVTTLEIKYNNKILKIHLVNIKNEYGTGGRIKYAYNKLGLNEDIMMTYGDGLSDINIYRLINFHYKLNKLVTVSAVYAPHRFGILNIKKNILQKFDNKNSNKMRINGGFFILSKKAIKYIKNFNDYWEDNPMQKIIKEKKLSAFKHNGFWACLDTLKDKQILNKLWFSKRAPWKIWK